MNNEIPLKNIYYMILYAFNKVKNKNIIDNVNFEKDYTASDVIIKLFLNEISNIVKAGIYKNYNDITEDSLYIKGKIDFKRIFKLTTVKRTIIHDDFNVDNILNSIIKCTLKNILYSEETKKHQKQARKFYPFFCKISDIEINDFLYQNLVLHKTNLHYDFAIKLSRFINKKIIPNEEEGKLSFYNILKDEETMSAIYEEFLRNFYRLHTNYKVSSKEYKWYLESGLGSDIKMLPIMKTDIEIFIDNKTKIIIDAKYYKNSLTNQYNQNKFISENIFQMNTYLQHNLKFNNLRGLLIYPSVGYNFHQIFKKGNQYTIEFHTIDLSLEWCSIENELLKIIFSS